MSSTDEGLKNAREFFAQLQKEPGNLKAVHSDLVRLATDRGFKCTVDDLTKALQELWEKRDQKMPMPYSEPPAF